MIWAFLIICGAFAQSSGPRVLSFVDVLEGHYLGQLIQIHHWAIETSPLILTIRYAPHDDQKLLSLAKHLAHQTQDLVSTSRLKILATDHPTSEYLMRGISGFAIGMTAFDLAFRGSHFNYEIYEKYFKELTRIEQIRAGALVMLYQNHAGSKNLKKLIQKQNWSMSIARLNGRIHEEGIIGSYKFGAFLDKLNSKIGFFNRCRLILSGLGRPL